jgi:hypothetical protein
MAHSLDWLIEEHEGLIWLQRLGEHGCKIDVEWMLLPASGGKRKHELLSDEDGGEKKLCMRAHRGKLGEPPERL